MKRTFIGAAAVMACLLILYATLFADNRKSEFRTDAPRLNSGAIADGNTDANANTNADSARTASAQDDIRGKIVFAINRIDIAPSALEGLREEFRKQYPNADVEFETIKDYGPKIKIRLLSDDAPDVMYNVSTSNDMLPRFYMPLDDLGFNAGNLDNYGIASFGGHVYGISEGTYLTGMLYDKKTFAAAGISSPPRTLDHLYADLDKLKARGVLPIGSMVKQFWPLIHWNTVGLALSGNPDYFNAMAFSDAPFAYDSDFGRQVSFVRALMTKGYMEKDLMTSDWDVLRKQMGTGRIGMLMMANYAIGALEGVDPEEVGFFPLPVDNSGTPVTMSSPGFDLVINKSTKNPATAKAFVKFWVERSSYPDLIGLMPAYKQRTTKVPQMKAFMDMKPRVLKNDPPTDVLNGITNKLQTSTYQIMAEALLAKNDADVKALLDDYDKKWAQARAELAE